jgi:ribosomal protein L24
MEYRVNIGDRVYVQSGNKAGFVGTVIDLNDEGFALIEFTNDTTARGWVKVSFLARLHV